MKAEGGGKKPKSEPADTPALPAFEASAESGLTDDQIRSVKTLQAGTMHVDDIIEATQIPARRVLSALTYLK